MNTAEIVTDSGWLFSNYRTETDFMFDKNTLDYELRKNSSDPLMKWMIFASKNKVMCSRKYQKLPEVLASLSGVLQFAILFLFLLTNLVTYVSSLKDGA